MVPLEPTFSARQAEPPEQAQILSGPQPSRGEHSTLRSPSPCRRTSGTVHGGAPDAALHHCHAYGEGVRQLRFSPAALQKAWGVRLTL